METKNRFELLRVIAVWNKLTSADLLICKGV